MKWFRWYHGTTTDLKFAAVAAATGAAIERVILTWTMVLESASEGETRGKFSITPKQIAAFMRCKASDIEEIFNAFEDEEMIKAGAVCNWDKRQFSSDNSTDRVRKHREKGAKCNGDETLQPVTNGKCNGISSVSVSVSEGEGVTKGKGKITNPKELDPKNFKAARGVHVERELQKFINWTEAKGRRHKNAAAAFRNWLLNAEEFTHNGDPPPPPKPKLPAAAQQAVDRLRTDANNAMKRGDFAAYKELAAKASAIEDKHVGS